MVDLLSTLAEAQNLHGDQTIEEWASYANRQPDELCGSLAELARCSSRAFIELFGCGNAPRSVKGAANMLVQKIPSIEGAYFVIRPGLMRALADRGLLDPLPSALDESGAETGIRAAPPPGASSPEPPSPAAGAPRPAVPPTSPGRSLAVARPEHPSGTRATSPGGRPPADAPDRL